MIELPEAVSLRTARPEKAALKPFQQALLEQAVALLSDLYDEDNSLLCHPVNRGFRPIRESLCYAALLLVRNRSAHVTDSGLLRARKVIDAVLARQNRNVNGASGGAFPLAWSEEKRSSIMDPDSRQLIGSLLAMLARDYAVELGGQRVEAIRRAVSRVISAENHDTAASAQSNDRSALHQRALRTWLEFERGDRLLGEELLIALTDETEPGPALVRFGKPQTFGLEFYAGALWCSSARLDDWGVRMLGELLEDIAGSLHPTLHHLLGSALNSRMHSEGSAAWINVWLTWLAMGSNPMLPRDMDNPLDATLFALPALTTIPAADFAERWAGHRIEEKRQLTRELSDRRISAWFEDDLQIEACHSQSVNPGSEPVLGAFWQLPGAMPRLTCQATGSHLADCDGRSVRLQNPGKCRITITGLGRGGTRLVEDGWELPGLRLTCRGFEIGNAERSEDGLNMSLRPVREQGLLVFSPMS